MKTTIRLLILPALVLSWQCTPDIHAQTLTIIHNFNPDLNGDGVNPVGTLAQGPDGYLYGTTSSGGTSRSGTIFGMGTSGSPFKTLFSFDIVHGGLLGGAYIAGPIYGRDGNLYGTTSAGGLNLAGEVYQYTPSGLNVLYAFTAGLDGGTPLSELVQGSDGALYGTASAHGAWGYGTVFRLTTAGTFSTLHSFNWADGSGPQAGLLQGTEGALYGTTPIGGAYGVGTVFRVKTDSTFRTLYSFSGGNDGSWPLSTLVRGNDGNFYGTTYFGGAYTSSDPSGSGFGTAFKISPDGAFTTIASFNNYNGANPSSTLVFATDGQLYGTTVGGCTTYPTYGQIGNFGTVVQMTQAGVIKTLVSFDYLDGYGNAPRGLIQASDGNLYGVCAVTGIPNGWYGNVFRVTLPHPPPDTNSPMVAISSPINGQIFTSSPIVVGGSASDPGTPSSGVALVEVRLNGGSWQAATSTTSWASWSSSVGLVSGPNLIEARSKDNAGNYSSLAQVSVTYSPSTPPPTISAFSVTPSIIVAGGAFTVSYTVADAGGPGLKQVELWRWSQPAGAWSVPHTNLCSGTASVLGTFRDTVSDVGRYAYGLHVVDVNGNTKAESDYGFALIWVTNQASVAPTISAFSVTPSIIVAGGAFTVSYTVADAGGPGLKQVELWRWSQPAGAWSVPHTNLCSGTASVPGTFSDAISDVGIYAYGLHVVDVNGNTKAESDYGFALIWVTVNPAPPVLNPPPGNFSGSVTVYASTTTSGATIRYTTNGIEPTITSPAFPVTGLKLTTTTLLKAKAFMSGMTASTTTSGTYTAVPPQVVAPVLNPLPGKFSGSVTVHASTTTSGATIRYTTNASEPTATSTAFPVAGLKLTTTTTVKAKAFKIKMTDSTTSGGTYTLTDLQGPTLLITSPANNAAPTGPHLPSLVVSGTATDSGRGNNGISSVTVNGVPATGGTAIGGAKATWSATVTLTPGINTITVIAKDSFNNQTQASISVTCSFGTVVGSFNGVIAYSNGSVGNDSQTHNSTGLEWQCVEYVNRYYAVIYGMNLVNTREDAYQFFSNAAALGLEAHANGGLAAPKVGDILCFKGGKTGLGHVAIVRGVGPSSVTAIQQNVTETTRDNAFTYGLTVSKGGNYTVSATALGTSYVCQGWLRKPGS